MTEQNREDRHLNTYLHGKSALSELYQQVAGGEPSARTDATILAAAKRAGRAKPRRAHWTIPLALAAMLIIGVSLVWWQQLQLTEPDTSMESAAPAREQTLPQQLDRSLHDNPAADQWLEKILGLHNAGKTDQAAAEFRKFRLAYPAYSIDQHRFAALQQYDN